MRTAEYKQVSIRTEQRVIHHDAEYDEAGNVTDEAWDETVDVQVPVMGIVYRDATPEEIEAMEQEEIPDMPQSPEDRIAELESALDTLLSGRTE